MIAWLILLNDQKCEGKCQEGFEPCGERCGLHKDEEGGEYACPTAESTLGIGSDIAGLSKVLVSTYSWAQYRWIDADSSNR
jgi:hypothetical protein